MPPLLQRLRAAPVTVVLFAICIVVFGLAEASGSTNDIPTLLRFGATWRGLVWSGEYWRLFTSMFLHIGLTHLVVNLWFGFSWAAPMEALLGPWRFLLVYVLSGIAGSALSVIGHAAVSAGASGALFGLMGATMVAFRLRLGSWAALWAAPPLRQTIIMGAVWLLAGPLLGFDSFAHGGGLIVGGALTWGLLTRNTPKLVGALVLTAALVGAALRPIPVLHDAWLLEMQKRSAE